MKNTTLLEASVFTAYTGEISNNLSFTNPYRYGYQNQEKSDASNPWYQFELRNYNQDLGRWFAPDPYGQFASPYIAMANNPVSGVDPDGGWVNAAPNEGRKFAGKDRMDWERENNTGAFSAEATQARYEDRYENLVKQYMGFENGNRNDVGGFMNAIGALNSEYYGLCKNSGINFSAQNGQQYLSQNEINLNENSVLATQGSIQTTDFQKGERAKMALDANSAWNALKSWSSTRREIIRNFGINLSDGKRIMKKENASSRASKELKKLFTLNGTHHTRGSSKDSGKLPKEGGTNYVGSPTPILLDVFGEGKKGLVQSNVGPGMTLIKVEIMSLSFVRPDEGGSTIYNISYLNKDGENIHEDLSRTVDSPGLGAGNWGADESYGYKKGDRPTYDPDGGFLRIQVTLPSSGKTKEGIETYDNCWDVHINYKLYFDR